MPIILDKVNYCYSADSAYKVQALKDINLKIEDGQFIGIIGHTGSGKSTLVQHLNGLLKATSGHIYYNGEDIYDEDYDLRQLRNKVGMVFQYPEHQLFETTNFEDVCFGPKNQGLDRKTVELRAYEALQNVHFPEDLYYQPPFDLSGGQKRRVAIAGVLAMHPEVLILDEPTNDLDIATLRVLEDFLDEFAGIVITVSHDRYFLNQTASRILELVNQTFVNYIGNYDYYLEKKEELTAKYAPVSPETSVNSKVTNPNTFSESQEPFGQKLSWQEQKEAQARERKRKNDLKKTEERIAVLETRNQEIDELMTQEDIYSNSVKCQELAIEKSSNEEELETLYEQWADLAEE